MIREGAKLCVDRPPVWNTADGSIDQMYWYFGATAMHWSELLDRRDAGHRFWVERARAALLGSQQENGSWNPDGAWGVNGGRVYATAMAVMTLLAAAQQGPDLNPKKRTKKVPGAYGDAITALRRAQRADDPLVAYRAKLALFDLGR
jgi:hypothetical protein